MKISFLKILMLLFVLCLLIDIQVRGQTANPPNTIQRNTGFVRVDSNGDIRIQPRAGFGVAMPSTCAGAPLSLAGEARWCYDGGTGAMRISVNGGVYLNWTNPGSAAGTVSSVGLALPSSLFSITGSPVTTSGILTGSFVTQAANTVFAAPVAGGVPSFINLAASHIPNLATSKLTTGVLGVDRGGTGIGSGFLFGDLLTFGTGSFNRLPGNITAARQFLRSVGDGVFTTAPVWDQIVPADINGTMPVSKGGTGLTTLGAANTFLTVNNAGTSLLYKPLVAGSNITFSNSDSGLTISATGTLSGLFQAADGSSSAPAYSFTNETDLGFYRSGDNSLGVVGGNLSAVGTAAILNNESSIELREDWANRGNGGHLGWGFSGTGSASLVASVTNHPGILSLTTGAAAGNEYAIYLRPAPDSMLDTESLWDVTFIIRTQSADSNTKIGFGLTGNVTGYDTPANTAGFYIEKDAADTVFKGTYYRNSRTVAAASMATVATGTWYRFRIRHLGANVIGWSVNGGAETTTGTTPLSSFLMPFLKIETTLATAKTIELDYVAIVMTGLSR
ncbi:MAG: hypothetical protein ACR2GW_07070 [Pyrinomonadaceae bacterium]